MREVGRVAVFWDYENCPTPSGVGGNILVNSIRAVAQLYGAITAFKAYADAQKCMSPKMLSQLELSGVSIVHCPHYGRKQVVDNRMMVDMMAYTFDNELVPATVVLISGDGDFSRVIPALRSRLYRVIVITMDAATRGSSSLQHVASQFFDWERGALQQGPIVNSISRAFGSDDQTTLSFSTPDSFPRGTSIPCPLLPTSNLYTASVASSEVGNICPGMASKPKAVPPQMKDLVTILEKSRLGGQPRQLWSNVALGLPDRKATYKNANASNFKPFVHRAKEAGIVELGGQRGPHPWIRLSANWHGRIRV